MDNRKINIVDTTLRDGSQMCIRDRHCLRYSKYPYRNRIP